MPTSKYRLNVSLPKDVKDALTQIAKRDRVPLATKAADLLELALEIEEDEIFGKIAAEREATSTKHYTLNEVRRRFNF